MHRPLSVSQHAMFEKSQISKSVDGTPAYWRHNGVIPHCCIGHTRTEQSCIHCTFPPWNGQPFFTFGWATVQRGLHSHFQERFGHNLRSPGVPNFERRSRLGHRTLAHKLEDRQPTITAGSSKLCL
jgi:hypothetical protein